MCHLLLLLPLALLPVFWLLPPSLSIPIYVAASVLAVWVYAYAIKAMRLPLAGEEAEIMQAVGTVVTVSSRGECRVELLGESWRATSSDVLKPGDRVRVRQRDGLVLQVEKLEPS
jgi:membrane protein implicated in regulation of membrane protease activity